MLGSWSSVAATDSLIMVSPFAVCTCYAIGGALTLSDPGWGVLSMATFATIITWVGF